MQNTNHSICVPQLEMYIKRFRPGFRARLRKLTRNSGELADLLVSFPAAAFALATDYGTEEQRKTVIDLVNTGRSTRIIAQALGLPYWMRKIPPEAFKRKLKTLPEDQAVQKCFAGVLPKKPDAIGNWLILVPDAFSYAHNEFALWLAKQNIFQKDIKTSNVIVPLAAYAWFSSQPETYAGKLIEQYRWNARMSFRKALSAARWWVENLQIELYFGSRGLSSSWLSSGQAGGYFFVPLLKQDDVLYEAQIMKNCAATYLYDIAIERCRLFSIRRGGQHVATLEIREHYEHEGIPQVEQLYGPQNNAVSHHVWQAVFSWLAKHKKFHVAKNSETAERQPDPMIWKKLWQPYWDVKGPVMLIPEEPNCEDLKKIEDCFKFFK